MYLDTRLFSFFSSGNQELRYDLITVRTKDIAVIKMLVVMDRVLRDGEDKKKEVNPKVLTNQEVAMEGIAGWSPFTGSSS